ncbi:hypothetical protein ACXYMX_09490 [Sporosarcina sp. CAU 1771]
MSERNMPIGNYSVLNTDSFDKRRYKEVFEMSVGLQKVRRESSLPMFDHLLSDVWASLYKMKPILTEDEVDVALNVNKLIMGRIMKEEHYVNYRRFTRLDDLTSVIGTIKIGERTNQWLEDRNEENIELQGIQLELENLERQLDVNGSKITKENISKEMIELNETMQQILHKNTEGFLEAIEQAIQETKEVKEGLNALLGGVSPGSGHSELQKMPLRNQLVLAERIASSKKMKEIADWAGRFKTVARKMQRAKTKDSVVRTSIEKGNDIEKLVPIELALWIHPLTRLDFLRRFVEGQTMQYEQRGRENLGKGPIVLCLDQSSSMYRVDAQSKGFALALLSIARKEKRDFCLLLFSTSLQMYTYEKGRITSSEMLQLARTFLGGGTDFTLPLEEALIVINKSRFKNADIVFVTDGEDILKESFLEIFNKKKKEKNFNVLSLVLGSDTKLVEQFSDKIVQVEDFDDEKSFEIFEL